MPGGGVFRLCEVQRNAKGAYTNTARVFEWTAKDHSAPRGSWKFGLEQRSVREDYPGNPEPVEQVLGWNFKPFTLRGVWDDRYMGAGQALDTYERFEELVQDGPVVSLEYETIAVFGLIKNAEFDYKRADYIGYEFEVSPHSRFAPGTSSRAPTGPVSPAPFNYSSIALTNDMMLLMDDYGGANMALAYYLALMTKLEDLMRLAAALSVMIDQRLWTPADPFEPFARMVHAFAEMRTAARSMTTDLRSFRSDTHIISQSAADVLNFEAWQRGLAYLLRLFIKNCLEAEAALACQATPRTAALYRPYEGESLYAISNRFYGTPHHWRKVMEANGIETTVLTGTELLVIPAMESTA